MRSNSNNCNKNNNSGNMVGVIYGICWDEGKENGNYYINTWPPSVLPLEFTSSVLVRYFPPKTAQKRERHPGSRHLELRAGPGLQGLGVWA